MTDPGQVFTVMDAQCALCAKGATWIARNDKRDEFRIVPVQSQRGRALMLENGIDPDDPASWLFVEHGRAYSSMEALIRVGWRLGGFGKVLILLRLIPAPLRAWLYRYVAQRRYVFGRANLCALPDPQVQRRLVDE